MKKDYRVDLVEKRKGVFKGNLKFSLKFNSVDEMESWMAMIK